jgi:hypothetical protein
MFMILQCTACITVIKDLTAALEDNFRLKQANIACCYEFGLCLFYSETKDTCCHRAMKHVPATRTVLPSSPSISWITISSVHVCFGRRCGVGIAYPPHLMAQFAGCSTV